MKTKTGAWRGRQRKRAGPPPAAAAPPVEEVQPSGDPHAAPYWHYAVVLLIPALLSWVNPNWLFQNIGHMDPWYYFGAFRTFPLSHLVVPNYATERMTWIAPGYAIVHLLGQVRGIIVLHWIIVWGALLPFHYILRRLADSRTALVVVVMFGCHPFFVSANGWDYPEGMAIDFILLSLALAIRASTHPRPMRILFASALAWSGAIYTYPNWIVFIPAYGYAALRLADRKWQPRSILRDLALMTSAFVLATALMWGVFLLMGGKGFFFKNNIAMALSLSQLKTNPWAYPYWYRAPFWLFFPVIAVVFGTVRLVVWYRKRERGREQQILIFYLFSFAVMVALTIRQNKLLTFDYRTSILLPSVFLVLGLTVLRVPKRSPWYVVYPVTAVNTAVCLWPLGRMGVQLFAVHREYILPATGVFVLVGLWMLFRRTTTAIWASVMMLQAAVSFPLTPDRTPWRMEIHGRDISERVTRAIDAVVKRLPPGRYPVFWYDNEHDALSSEGRGIMCSFLTHMESMMYFPAVTRHYAPGIRIFTISGQPDIVPAAVYELAHHGMPAGINGWDKIEYGGVAYQLTALEVLPETMPNVRKGLQPLPGQPADEGLARFARKLNGPESFRYAGVALPGPGVYEFELHYRLDGGAVKLGADVSHQNRTLEEWSNGAVQEDGDQVSWLRVGVEAGQTIDLELQVTSAAGARPVFTAPPRLVVLRDPRAVSPELFNSLVETAEGQAKPR